MPRNELPALPGSFVRLDVAQVVLGAFPLDVGGGRAVQADARHGDVDAVNAPAVGGEGHAGVWAAGAFRAGAAAFAEDQPFGL